MSFSKFFIIKSYTEEDVHKAIKYKIWSSTDRGNKILDSALAGVNKLKEENPNLEAEVYLFFSVNKSKHFCGLAKMVRAVNHKHVYQNMWKQDGKWPGSIDIEWVQIKDIPNTQFIHIENPLNENRPACQGRDCQEIYPKIGESMLGIFHNFRSTTKLFDDFKFYDEQEKFRHLRSKNQTK